MLFSTPIKMASKTLVGVALIMSTTSAYAASSAAACQPGQAGCVLPVTDPAAVPPPPVEAAPYVETTGGGGIGILPILAGLALIGLAAYLLLDDDDEEEISPN